MPFPVTSRPPIVQLSAPVSVLLESGPTRDFYVVITERGAQRSHSHIPRQRSLYWPQKRSLGDRGLGTVEPQTAM